MLRHYLLITLRNLAGYLNFSVINIGGPALQLDYSCMVNNVCRFFNFMSSQVFIEYRENDSTVAIYNEPGFFLVDSTVSDLFGFRLPGALEAKLPEFCKNHYPDLSDQDVKLYLQSLCDIPLNPITTMKCMPTAILYMYTS